MVGLWRGMPFISTLRRQSHMNLCEFKASLDYRVSSKTAMAVHRETVSKKTKMKTKQNGVDETLKME